MYFTYILVVFSLREPCKKTTATEKAKILLSSIRKVINPRFSDLFFKLNELTDSRKRKEYLMSEIITGSLFMYIFKEASRNAYNNNRREDSFRENVLKYFGFNLPHTDTSDDVLRELLPDELETLKSHLVSGLIEQKFLRKFRFMNKSYLVAVDAIGIATFDHKHCDHCLTKTSKSGVVTYFHYVLEAKLVTPTGLAISLASEFIENEQDRDYEKQDCEQKAFVRLAAKIKKYFPRLPLCILGDGLYPNNTVFDICRKNSWQFIITLKDGNLKTFQQEVALLKATSSKKNVYRATKITRTTLEYEYLNDIEYDGRYYQLLQIAHMINQLVERSKLVVALMEEHTKQTIVDQWRKMIAYLIFSHTKENILTPSLPD